MLWDNILIKPIYEEMDGNIVRPAQHEDRSTLGEVVAIGSGRVLADGTIVPIQVKVGDKVAFNRYCVEMHNIGGEEFWTLKEEDIKFSL